MKSRNKEIFKVNNSIYVLVFLILVILALGELYMSSCSHLPPDGPMEEFAEKLIDETIGLDIDLSPNE